MDMIVMIGGVATECTWRKYFFDGASIQANVTKKFGMESTLNFWYKLCDIIIKRFLGMINGYDFSDMIEFGKC